MMAWAWHIGYHTQTAVALIHELQLLSYMHVREGNISNQYRQPLALCSTQADQTRYNVHYLGVCQNKARYLLQLLQAAYPRLISSDSLVLEISLGSPYILWYRWICQGERRCC